MKFYHVLTKTDGKAVVQADGFKVDDTAVYFYRDLEDEGRTGLEHVAVFMLNEIAGWQRVYPQVKQTVESEVVVASDEAPHS
jgi:hypothetical protein